ncbi:MAG TPA: hypothetical protein PLS84_03320 [Salinivirgaceae bacterium]|nr:hypothetical protein [Salinivirgaceae bacterium]
MKNNILITLIVITLVCFVAMLEQSKEINRQKLNFVALNEKLYHYKTANGQQATQISSLILSNKELKTYNKELVSQVEDLKIKLKNVQSISIKTLESNYNINSTLKDSTVLVYDTLTKTVIDTTKIKYTSYKDDWISFKQTQIDDKVNTEIKTRDSITIVQHWEPYRFLFFKWGKKKSKETVTNSNPYSTVTHSISIIKK